VVIPNSEFRIQKTSCTIARIRQSTWSGALEIGAGAPLITASGSAASSAAAAGHANATSSNDNRTIARITDNLIEARHPLEAQYSRTL